MSQPSQYPERVTFYGLMAIQAARRASGLGGGYRLYILAKALDRSGLGMIRREDLRLYALWLGVEPRTWQRWITEARNHDLVRDVQKASGEWWLILPAAGLVAHAMGCDPGQGIGRKIEMRAVDLIGNGWKARAFTAWESGKTISREQIQKAVNVPVRTQSHRNIQAAIKKQRNYSKSKIKSDSLAGIEEYTYHKGTFSMRDGFIAWRLPDTRTAEHAETLGKGRSRKANKLLRAAMRENTGLSKRRQALSDDIARAEWVRLFNLTKAQRRAAERKLAKLDTLSASKIFEVYQWSRAARSGAAIWTHYPIRGG